MPDHHVRANDRSDELISTSTKNKNITTKITDVEFIG